MTAEGGGDAPESGLEAVALAIASPWTRTGDRRRQVIVLWSDQPAHHQHGCGHVRHRSSKR